METMRYLETQMWEAAKNQDKSAFLNVVSESAVMVCGGYRCLGDEYSGYIENFGMEDYKIVHFEVIYQTEDLFQVHYIVKTWAKDIENEDIAGVFHVTSTWKKINDKWKMIFNMDSRILSVYEACPHFEGDRYQLCLVSTKDCEDLLKVYSDKLAVPFFNSDNCGGDDFYYTTRERMAEAIDYWLFEYQRKAFVRWSIIDKDSEEAIGTIELFRRDSEDYFTDCGLLRLDLRSDYENVKEINEILTMIVWPAFTIFDCSKIVTKAIPAAEERIKALEKMNFRLSEEKLIGHDGTEYSSYYVLEK